MAGFIKNEQRVGEMEENTKGQDGSDKTLSISILKLNKQHVLLYFSTYMLRVNNSVVCKDYILVFRFNY